MISAEPRSRGVLSRYRSQCISSQAQSTEDDRQRRQHHHRCRVAHGPSFGLAESVVGDTRPEPAERGSPTLLTPGRAAKRRSAEIPRPETRPMKTPAGRTASRYRALASPDSRHHEPRSDRRGSHRAENTPRWNLPSNAPSETARLAGRLHRPEPTQASISDGELVDRT